MWIKPLAEGIKDKVQRGGEELYAMFLDDLSSIPYMILNTLLLVVVVIF